jgi:hypothetical protein
VNHDLELSHRMMRASERCSNIAASEKVMGYLDNFQVYLDISDECRNITAWVIQYRNQQQTFASGSSEARRVSTKAT